MKSSVICFVAGLATAVLGSGFAHADDIILTNGDKLSVVIKEVTEKGAVVQHTLLGELTIPLETIESPKLTQGSVTAQELSKQLTAEKQEDKKKLEQAKEAAKADTESLLEETDPKKNWFSFEFLPGWSKSVQLGFSGSEGNSNTSNINGGFKAKFEDDEARWDFDSAFFWGKSDGKETKNQAFAQLVRDWKLDDSRLFIFLQSRYDYDTFQAFRHRIAPNTGFGYQFFETEKFKLKGQVGSGFAYNFGDVEDKFVPEATFGMKGSWQVNANNTLTGSSQFFPDVSDALEEYRAISSLDWKIKMDQLTGLSLKFGLLHEYNTQTNNSRTNRSDVKYYGTLVYDF